MIDIICKNRLMANANRFTLIVNAPTTLAFAAIGFEQF